MLSPDKVVIEEVLKTLAQDRASERGWTSLYRLMWPFVIATIFRTTHGDRDGIEDIAQEVFLRLVRFCDFSAFNSSEAFLGFVHAVCKNAARDELRKRKALKRAMITTDIESVSASDLPYQDFVDREIILSEVFSELEGEDLKLAEYLLNGFTLTEIAARTQQSYGGLAVRFHRLRAKLRSSS